MQRYNRHELEDYDDFIEYESEQEEEEEHYEEKEDRKPTKEELDYLELRQRLKERIRRQMKKENSSTRANVNGRANFNDKRNRLPSDNYGSFFGPSQPVIAQRVIQESKSLLETKHLTSRVSNSSRDNKGSVASKTSGSRPGAHGQPSKVVSQLKSKVQKLKDTRDYSFLLSDDAQLPAAATKEPPPRSVYVSKSEARPAQVPAKRKQAFGNSGRNAHDSEGERKSVPVNRQIQLRGKLPSSSKPSLKSMESKKELGSVSGNRPGLHAGSKDLPSKMSTGMHKKPSIPSVKNSASFMQKNLPSKLQSSFPKQIAVQKKGVQEPTDSKMMRKQLVASSKSQLYKQTVKPPQKQNLQRPLQEIRPKKKSVRRYSDDEGDDEDGEAINMIRKMFGYNPTRYSNRDDDDSDMEANFDDIMREEKRSSKIARREDEEQLRLIQEEEEREERARINKLKKLKLGER